MTDIKLGQLIENDAQRDAIHIAIAPVEAYETLMPGWHVGLLTSGKASAAAVKLIGIVDPFLKKMVRPGERFWLCLYQNTVTGMRHHWSHPAFKDFQTVSIDAEETVRDFCEEYELGYDELLDAWRRNEYITIRGQSGPFDNEDGVKLCLTALTGHTNPNFFFSCSC